MMACCSIVSLGSPRKRRSWDDSTGWARPMAHLTRRFELTWYGYHAATSADWDDAMQQLETLECLRSSTQAIAGS